MSGRVGDWTPADREDELGIDADAGERPEDFGPEEDEDDLGICARCAFYGTDDCVDPDNFDIVTMLCTGFSERN